MSAETKVLYDFGRFRCDPREQLLLCEGKPIPLAPKSFDILLALVRSNGRLVTKDELMRQVWPDSFVEEANLTVNISALRKALGEAPGGQQYIETVPKRGYRFITPVAERQQGQLSSPPVKTVAKGGSEEVKVTPQVVPSGPSRRWLVAAGVLFAALLVTFLVSSRHTLLTDKDTVVLAEISNKTGDPVFDDALRQGLSAQLEQSPFLNLLSDERIAATLSFMTQPKDSRLTHELAREVCQRTASSAVLEGAIAQVGSQYLFTLKAVNCSNGDSLGSAESQANDKNHVLDALGKAASEMRSRLGESLASVQKYDAPPEDVTTSSLEALKAYSLGYRAMILSNDYAAAIPLFQRAIALDSDFAMAYARIGTCYSVLNDNVRAAENIGKAHEFRKGVSERERLYITSHYQHFVTGNMEAARRVYELSLQTYPHETPLGNLAAIYSELGYYDQALATYQQALRMDPDTGDTYGNLINGYVQVNRLDEARATALQAQSREIDSPEIHLHLYWVNFLQHDGAGMDREAAALMGKAGYEDQILNSESDTALYHGNLSQARQMTARAVEAALRGDEQEAAAIYTAQGALHEVLAGNDQAAKAQVRAALARSHGRDVLGFSALALALVGDSTRASQLSSELAKAFPVDTIAQFNYLPCIRAAIHLRNSDPAKAIDSLIAAGPYELGGNFENLNFLLYPVYLRGESYLAQKKGESAAAEFQKIVDHAGLVRNEPIGALARLQLARAFTLSGDTTRALQTYNEFLALWKDADLSIPILKEANAELSKLLN
jgi:DNA-binding winged helix-turn-helix (wHTH) protein/tetratricopeptide (TPR) repeat protein